MTHPHDIFCAERGARDAQIRRADNVSGVNDLSGPWPGLSFAPTPAFRRTGLMATDGRGSTRIRTCRAFGSAALGVVFRSSRLAGTPTFT